LVDLKTFLGLAMPNQSWLDVTVNIKLALGDIYILYQTLMIPTYSTTILYDMTLHQVLQLGGVLL